MILKNFFSKPTQKQRLILETYDILNDKKKDTYLKKALRLNEGMTNNKVIGITLFTAGFIILLFNLLLLELGFSNVNRALMVISLVFFEYITYECIKHFILKPLRFLITNSEVIHSNNYDIFNMFIDQSRNANLWFCNKKTLGEPFYLLDLIIMEELYLTEQKDLPIFITK